MMRALVLTAFTAVTAAGRGRRALVDALLAGRGGLRPCRFENLPIQTYTGEVDGVDDEPVGGELAAFDCRNNRLAQLALGQDGFAEAVAAARERYGARRMGVVLGTSTSGILETEHAYQHRDPAGRLPGDLRFSTTHNLYASAEYVRRALNLKGPAAMISTACSSSAKAFAQGWRMMAGGLCDTVVVGGVDSLCRNTLYGFASLELVSREACRPCAADRSGISIGEAAGFALLEWPERAGRHSGVALLGYGESADAYHMATPHPEGEGAVLAMRGALNRAGLDPADIDYINMHATSTLTNDAMEDRAISRVFGGRTAASGTKGWTGHTLGAAGITEAVISAVCVQEGIVPGCLNARAIDPGFQSLVVLETGRRPVRRVLSNSFGFGGSNCSLVFGKAETGK